MWPERPDLFQQPLIDEPGQIGVKSWLPQLLDSLRLNLADPFPGNAEDAADLFKRVAVAVGQTETQLEDLPLAGRKGLQHLADRSPQRRLVDASQRVIDSRIADEFTRGILFAVAQGLVERDHSMGHPLDAADLLQRHAGT